MKTTHHQLQQKQQPTPTTPPTLLLPLWNAKKNHSWSWALVLEEGINVFKWRTSKSTSKRLSEGKFINVERAWDSAVSVFIILKAVLMNKESFSTLIYIFCIKHTGIPWRSHIMFYIRNMTSLKKVCNLRTKS